MDLLSLLEKKIVRGSLIALSLLLGIGIVSLVSIRDLVHSAEQVRQVQASVEKLEATLSHLKDIETGTRGYLITGKMRFLEPYQSALGKLSDDLDLLPTQLHAATNRSFYLPRLNSLIEQRLTKSKQLIEQFQKKEFDQVSQLELLEEGKRLMDQIRVLVSQMQMQERSLLSLQESQNKTRIIFSIIIIVGGSFLAIGCVLIAMVLIRRDVTKRRQAEEKLLQSEQLLNSAQRIAKMGSWEYEVEKDTLLASAGLHQIFEVAATGNSLSNSSQFYYYLHPDDIGPLQQASTQCILTGESFQTEYRLLLSEGKQKYILSYVTPLEEADGKVRKVQGTCQDITELKYAQEALIHSEKLFSTIFQLNPFPTAITRLSDGKVIVANQKAMQVFGYTPLELSKLTTVELKLWNSQEDRQKLIEQVKKNPVLVFEKRYRSKEGIEWDAMTYLDVIEWDGELCLLIILQDITERKKAEEAIKTYAEHLEKLNASKDKFFSIIAHDLLSPLNGVLGSSAVLSTYLDTLTAQDVQTLSQGIYNSTTQLKKLLTNLLEWARMQKGELVFNPTWVDLYKIVIEEVAALQENAHQKGLAIHLDIEEQVKLKADEHMLRSVIRNLLANATKFSTAGGCIYIRGEQLDTTVQVSVRDTGIGMKKQVQERLFHLDVKQTSIGTAGEKGTGLGLMLCKEFIEKHGGQIWVESQERKGTTFSFSLPNSEIL